MKQLLILSGKGGTGKTTIASAFIKLAAAKTYADCDVDAPNLHLVSGLTQEPQKTDYYGLPKAEIDENKCIACGKCRQSCRFEAISQNGVYQVDPYACEGCGVCQLICPEQAISLIPAVAGDLILYQEKERVFSTAQLKMGSGNSGKLVTEVKKQMKSAAINDDIAIIDGSPGIGCPVIASISGVDMVLIVTEPSLSGMSDMERIIKTTEKFGVKIAVCLNRYDTNQSNSEKIELFCRRQDIPFMGRIPYDSEAVKAVNRAQTIVDIECKSGTAVRSIFAKTMQYLEPK